LVTREAIERTLRHLNEVENSRSLDPTAKSDLVDGLSADDVQGWANGTLRGGRAEEREQEAFLWSTFPDYHREFERVVIEPPVAAVQWRMTGSNEDLALPGELHGVSIMEFDEDGRIKRFWMYYDDPLRG
jgi:hypothetical protein